jgi:hypothetical protein
MYNIENFQPYLLEIIKETKDEWKDMPSDDIVKYIKNKVELKIGEEIRDIVSKSPEFKEISKELQKKIILGEI